MLFLEGGRPRPQLLLQRPELMQQGLEALQYLHMHTASEILISTGSLHVACLLLLKVSTCYPAAYVQSSFALQQGYNTLPEPCSWTILAPMGMIFVMLPAYTCDAAGLKEWVQVLAYEEAHL